MCLEDLKIARRKYSSQALNLTDASQSRRPGSRTTLFGPLTNNGEVGLVVGTNDKRTALRVCVAPEMVFDTENQIWVFFDTIVLGFPVEPGISDPHDQTGPLNVMFALSTNSKLESIITIEEVGTLIYGAWGFLAFSTGGGTNIQTISVTDISADAAVMAKAQDDMFLR